ncbi:MAG: putative phospholipid-binding lipoprotein MlaA precursor [Lentisphaerae bacterium ADurb.Bin242]|nr:MAG: putative phospholipid-binding lipoprotein MlaA precursor [Lentisphaerae bacterium ADurb.Bin242]
MKKWLVLSCLLPVLFSGCATRETDSDELSQPGHVRTPSAIVEDFGGSDPIEPFNRVMFEVNDALMHYLVRPFSWVYGSILPKEVIQRVQMASDNLAFPGRLVSCLLQAKFTGSGIVLTRFVANSTVGIAGLFDPADAWFGMPPRNENMGQAFASWGIGPGFVLLLPLSTSINFRDQVGLLFDSVLDLKIIIPYAGTVAGVNRAVNLYDDYVIITETAADPYDYLKMGFVAARYAQVNELAKNPLVPPSAQPLPGPWIPEDSTGNRIQKISGYYCPQGGEIDTVKFILFGMRKNDVSWWVKSSLWNTDFVSAACSRSVRMKEGAPKLHYQLWKAENPESPLVVLLPGVGSYYKAPHLRALAELFRDGGCSALVLSSTFNKAFIETMDFRYPGYTPDDAACLRDVLKKVMEDVRENTGLKPSRTILVGSSMGGLHALFIADMEKKNPSLGFSRYVALNPPVDLQYALSRFDNFTDISKKWTREECSRQVGDIIMKYVDILSRKHPPLSARENGSHNHVLPFSKDQASFMAGLAFRLTLRELLLSARRCQGDRSGIKTEFNWWNRSDLYRELDTFSGMKYVEECILPQQKKKDPSATLEKMNRESGLRAIGETLRNNPAVRVIHNIDDPLLSEADRCFLSDTLGSKIIWFDCGGHLGCLFVEEYQKTILAEAGVLEEPAKESFVPGIPCGDIPCRSECPRAKCLPDTPPSGCPMK